MPHNQLIHVEFWVAIDKLDRHVVFVQPEFNSTIHEKTSTFVFADRV